MKSYKTKEEKEQLLNKTGFHTVKFYEHSDKKYKVKSLPPYEG